MIILLIMITFFPYLPQEETITETYKETYDKISMVCDDTRPCSPHVDEGLEILFPCNVFETKSSEEYCYEYKEDMDRQEHDTMDEESPTYNMDGDDDYWKFMGKPIYDMSREGSACSKSFIGFIENPICDMSTEGSVNIGTWGGLSMEEEHSNFSHDHSKPYHPESHTSISNEYFERQCIEKSNLIQLMGG